ncbi:alpha/beta fold hydrolase [Mumia sp. zg.B53]|uniref:alpha/beta hydrolase n=1 Tax=unclassified Mumia TaxID=2621872 RepID=UPI001C6F20DB|nr:MULTISPECIES: alpha/beta fold hydrolase [unclassified Mumia]MBW9206261.1 alpha/beta fold hydrolase [Mumia sp. zg.B17]MBW9211445.1 alpha/beta fold hydrolase [Mumia sp. zg.B21]MBW9216618.1 alpha/beta fold hydrolase [Mumia sp. zg.B53]MDD9347912.1 alpha/beta fold hydrolase [Mumia sp.]
MADSPALHPLAHPLVADGGPTGVLLLHGFTGSPASMAPWGRHLADRGFTVRVPRLPGHGTTWQELNRTRWDDWYAEADRTLSELRGRCEHVAVAGLSMGGALALRLAEQRPDDLDAVVLVNPAVTIADRRLAALPVVRHLVPSLAGIGNDIKKSGVEESGYDRTPLHALWSQTRLWADVRANLHKVSQPLLMFRSAEDHVVDPSSGRLILAGVSSAVAVEVVLTDSYHVATLDNDAERIWSESADFIARHTAGTTLEGDPAL